MPTARSWLLHDTDSYLTPLVTFINRCLKEMQGDAAKQLENVKIELLKLTKKEAADCQLWHNMARTGERKKQKNKEIDDCQTWHNAARREKPKKQKNKEIADCQQWYNMQENAV
ncbi:hypothetical protein AVEN_120103-1 [Araneus ventricosus]|uniref:Uncharacterized protein n=1 Tax=Araneus ventricosus TaxID=182803 RepID=A0A4Y2G4M9_ARAVE|nr:hypothetical protein AVEN_120103-1 [Araneus ventricosus]